MFCLMEMIKTGGGWARRGWAHRRCWALGAGLLGATLACAEDVYLREVPDYQWHLACFGTATGNLIGYWDRHGFPNFYTGPTAGGVAPLDSYGAHAGIYSLWGTKAGLDGRPANRPGHEDDYYIRYESTETDPYLSLGRPEHEPDCLGDFLGLNQKRWVNMNGECDGNIDGYSFVYWDPSGNRRVNFTPSPAAGLPAIDVPSGLRAWTQWRGSSAEVFTQLSDFNPHVTPGKGFHFEDLKSEINAGYPVLLFMQDFYVFSRAMPGMERANPVIHGMLAYGYFITQEGRQYVRYRTSWASGDYQFSEWNSANWTPEGSLFLPLRGVIGYHPRPKITAITPTQPGLVIRWEGPASELVDVEAGTVTGVNWYVVERAANLAADSFTAVSEPTLEHELRLDDCCAGTAFFRVKLVHP